MNNGRIGGFEYSSDGSAASLAVSAAGNIRFLFRTIGASGAEGVEWSPEFADGTRRVFHVVFDSNQLLPADRLRLYVNGTLQPSPLLTLREPALGARLDLSQAGLQLAIANRPTGGRAILGSVHYLGVYSGVLAATTIASQASALLANDDDVSMALTLTPKGTDTIAQLPSNGVRYRQSFRLVNGSSDWEYFDLKARPGAPGSSFIAIDSVGGSGAGAAVAGDSARTVVLAPGTAADLTVTYRTVGGTVGGLDSLYLTGTSVTDHTTPRASEQGWVYVRLAEARMTLAKAVATTGPRIPGVDLAYTITLANAGSKDAAGVVLTCAPGSVPRRRTRSAWVLPPSTVGPGATNTPWCRPTRGSSRRGLLWVRRPPARPCRTRPARPSASPRAIAPRVPRPAPRSPGCGSETASATPRTVAWSAGWRSCV